MPRLGPSFAGELVSADLSLPIAWSRDGDILGLNRLTPQQRARLNAVIAAHDPDKPADVAPDTAISRRQLFQALALHELITKEAAVSAVTIGAIPPVISGSIGSLPPANRFAAQMYFGGGTSFARGHDLIKRLGPAFGINPARLDDIWRLAASL